MNFSTITPGCTYILTDPPTNPFEKDNPCLVEVLEVKEHWVRFKMLPEGGLFQNENMHIIAFRLLFSKIKEADWIGKVEKRFNWRKLKFAWGRWHYNTNCCGDTTDKWWVVGVGEK